MRNLSINTLKQVASSSPKGRGKGAMVKEG